MTQERATRTQANRLAQETSPYLLQHACNPVDWYPWGREAFDLARNEDKPVFLSIGYSTCHWCHVMERESFEDEQTAELLNGQFVSIKVDREERPDIDDTYMRAVQIMTGSGGWPLSVFLTPDGRPFYGGTYFPPRAGFGRPSFRQVLSGIAQAWATQRADVVASAQSLTQALGRPFFAGRESDLSPEVLDKAFDALASQFDPVHSGFGSAPKFPQPTMLTLLLRHWRRTGEPAALDIVERTLDAMARGGIHDHLGGGFHRYSTDARWLVPHFEKMLCDQALLSRAYVQAYQIGKKATHATVARGIFGYVLRDMTHDRGGFYAAEDADSEGREGAFYVWRRDEIESLLDSQEAEAFCRCYGVTAAGNFEHGESILHKAASAEEVGENAEEIVAGMSGARERLLQHRNTRLRPHRDDKIITSWNGLMISSLACGGAVLGDDMYIQAARRAAEFVLDSLFVDDRLMRYWRAGRAVGRAFLDDYAFLIAGLIDLYEATFEVQWLHRGARLAQQMMDLFADEAEGGFFTTGKDAERLVSRDKPGHDGALPGGNSVAALVLLRLGKLLMNDRFTREAERVLRLFSGRVVESPTAFTAMLQALDLRLGPSQEVVLVGESVDAQPLIEETRRHFLPNATVLFREVGPEGDELTELVPFTRDLSMVDGRAAAYVCENYTCRRPVTTAADLRTILDAISPKPLNH